jgi:tetratricopeptide (TPR) repeat protein
VYIAEDDLSAARDVFRKITESSPHSDRGWAALGLLEARLGNHDRALDDLDRAIAENPLLPEVQLARGELLLTRGENAEAKRALDAAANLLHDDRQLAARMGQALLALNQPVEALPQLRSAVDQGFAPDDVQRALALALALNGRLEESDRVLSRAGLAENGDTEIVRGVLMLKRSSYAAAEEILKKVTEERANEAEVLNLFAATLYDQERYAEAVTYLEAAVNVAPSSAPIQENLQKAQAARAAELLAEQANTVKAAP